MNGKCIGKSKWCPRSLCNRLFPLSLICSVSRLTLKCSLVFCVSFRLLTYWKYCCILFFFRSLCECRECHRTTDSINIYACGCALNTYSLGLRERPTHESNVWHEKKQQRIKTIKKERKKKSTKRKEKKTEHCLITWSDSSNAGVFLLLWLASPRILCACASVRCVQCIYYNNNNT